MNEHDKYWKIVEAALKQIEYDIHCLDNESILVLSRIIHSYVSSQDRNADNSKNQPTTRYEEDRLRYLEYYEPYPEKKGGLSNGERVELFYLREKKSSEL